MNPINPNNNENKFNFSYPNQPIRGIIGTGKEGNKPGEFNFPTSVCYEQGYIIVSDKYNNRVQLFDSNTLQFHSMFGSNGNEYGQVNDPYGMCIQPFTCNLLVCDPWNHRIQIFNNNNNNSSSPYSFSYQIGSTTEIGSEEIGEFYYPQGLCCDNQGHIIVSDSWNYRIQEFNENGRFLHSFGSEGSSFDQFDRPNSVCFDKEHHQLLISDCYNKRVSIWSHDSSSKPQPISCIQLNNLCYSVCIDPLRNHQIVVGTNYNVFVYDNRTYKVTQTLGTGSKKGSELGEFNYVTGLCVNEDDGSLIVVDYYNHRIQIF